MARLSMRLNEPAVYRPLSESVGVGRSYRRVRREETACVDGTAAAGLGAMP